MNTVIELTNSPALLHQQNSHHIHVYNSVINGNNTSIPDNSDIAVKSIKKYGFYSATIAVVFICLYHAATIAYPVWWALNDNRPDWCAPIVTNYIILHFESFFVYLTGYFALTHDTKNYSKFSKSKITQNLVIIFIVVTYISGFLPVVDSKHYQYGEKNKVIELMMILSGAFRYGPPAAPMLILYGYLKSFNDELTDFREETGTICNESSQRNKIDITKVSDLDDHKFKINFIIRCNPYQKVMKKFSCVFFLLSIFNFLTWCCIFWGSVKYWKGTGCELSAYYYTHYLIEIIYFFVLWAIVGWILLENNQLMVRYRYQFRQMTVENKDLQNHVVDFLKIRTEYYSPFAIFGFFNPNVRNISVVFISGVVPVMTQIYGYATSQ